MVTVQTNETIDSNRLSHAYIVSGGLAEKLAMAAVCSGSAGEKPCGKCHNCDKASRNIHPDIFVVDKPADKRDIIVEQIRELKKDVIVVPNEAAKKAYIINAADLMNRNAQNAFLRILEEPPKHAVFILRTDTPAMLLPTIRSRCVELRAESETKPNISGGAAKPSIDEMADELLKSLKHGNTRLAAFMFRLERLEKEAMSEFLIAAREMAASKLRENPHGDSSALREKLAHAERVMVKAGEMLDLNVSMGHISGLICASLLETNDAK